MKKASVLIILALALLLVVSSPLQAQVDFFIDAELPSANTATFNVSQVFVGPPLNFVPQNTFNLDFGILTLNVDGVFEPVPPFFWAIDVGSNGAGMPDITLAYTDTANPNGALNNGDGLGGRSTVNFAEIVTNPDNSQTTNDITTVALGDLASLAGGGIDETQFANGFLRMSIGLATDNTVALATPFTSLDADGVFSGTYTVTATFD